MKCPHCEGEMLEESRFCPNCGKTRRINGDEDSTVVEKKAENVKKSQAERLRRTGAQVSKREFALIAAAAVVGLMMLGAAAFLMGCELKGGGGLKARVKSIEIR